MLIVHLFSSAINRWQQILSNRAAGAAVAVAAEGIKCFNSKG